MKDDVNNEDEDDDDEALDMEEFEESGMLDQIDPSTATIKNVQKSEVKSKEEGDTDSVVRTRTYDLHITYDKYYQTPRLWVVGYDEVNFD